MPDFEAFERDESQYSPMAERIAGILARIDESSAEDLARSVEEIGDPGMIAVIGAQRAAATMPADLGVFTKASALWLEAFVVGVLYERETDGLG